jgi:hypothetical protein
MAELVAAYPVGAFTDPQNGNSPVDADEVRANDDAMRSSFNSHDGDATIHFQSSLIATRPAAGTVGRKWFTSDSFQVFRDNGSSWDEIDYLNKTNGGTVAGATTFTGTLTSTAGSRTFGATTFSGTITGTAASFSSTISAAGATLTGALTGTSATFSSAVSTGALTATTGTFSGVVGTTAGRVNISGGINPNVALDDGSGPGFLQIVAGDINFTPRAGKAVTVSSDFNIGAGKFVVAGSSGNTTVAGTLGVTGTTTVQVLTAVQASFSAGIVVTNNGAPAVLNNSAVAGVNSLITAQRGNVTRYFIGFNASDEFALLNAAGGASNLSVTDAGALAVRAGISAAGDFTINTNKFVINATTGNAVSLGDITAVNFLTASTAGLFFGARSFIASPADGNLKVSNQAGTDFGLLQFGGTSSSFPALKRSTTGLLLRLADDSNYSFLRASSLLADSLNFSNFVGTSKILGGTTGTVIRNNADNADNLLISDLGAVTTRSTFQSGASIVAEATSSITWSGRSVLKSPSDGTLTLLNNAASGFTMLQFGGTTSSFYAVKQGLVGGLPALRVRLADDSADAGVQCSQLLVGTGGISTQGTLVCSDGPVSAFTDVSAGGVFKKSGTQVVGARSTGWATQTGPQAKTDIGGVGAFTLDGLAALVRAMWQAMTTHGLIGA